MRKAPNLRVEQYRIDGPKDSNYGFFVIPWRGNRIRVQTSAGGGWDHVSVSTASDVPTWEQMCRMKQLFFYDDEVVMQLHPAKVDYINNHPRCLHLWRPQTAAEIEAERELWERSGEAWPYEGLVPQSIPLPPHEFVGIKELNVSGATS